MIRRNGELADVIAQVGVDRPGAYLVIDRTQDMLFVVLQNAPSARQLVQVNIKKLIYDAFEK